MKVTEREFRIGAFAALSGFMLCYFLFDQATPPRGASQMTIIAALPRPSVQTNWIMRGTNRFDPRFLLQFQSKPHPELRGGAPRPNADLTSYRYKAEVNLSDL